MTIAFKSIVWLVEAELDATLLLSSSITAIDESVFGFAVVVVVIVAVEVVFEVVVVVVPLEELPLNISAQIESTSTVDDAEFAFVVVVCELSILFEVVVAVVFERRRFDDDNTDGVSTLSTSSFSSAYSNGSSSFSVFHKKNEQEVLEIVLKT
jgi:hypothetical protein